MFMNKYNNYHKIWIKQIKIYKIIIIKKFYKIIKYNHKHNICNHRINLYSNLYSKIMILLKTILVIKIKNNININMKIKKRFNLYNIVIKNMKIINFKSKLNKMIKIINKNNNKRIIIINKMIFSQINHIIIQINKSKIKKDHNNIKIYNNKIIY